MNAEFEIKKQILIDLLRGDPDLFEMPSDDKLNEFYEEAQETEWADYLYDQESEFRCSGEDTNLCPEHSSRHYGCKQVARVLDSGKSVSWTYWYGGGKHGEPGEIDWMDDAYFVECRQETTVVNVYTKIKQAA